LVSGPSRISTWGMGLRFGLVASKSSVAAADTCV
jgi:hypothetical protein